MPVIDKVAWILIRGRKVLGVRSKGKDTPFTPGGKREGNESDAEALVREIQEELSVALQPSSITYLNTFVAQAYGKPEGTHVELKCYSADFRGVLRVDAEIEAMEWLTSADTPRLSIPFQKVIAWLKEKELID